MWTNVQATATECNAVETVGTNDAKTPWGLKKENLGFTQQLFKPFRQTVDNDECMGTCLRHKDYAMPAVVTVRSHTS